MNPLPFDFTVDKAAQTIYITRSFDAKLSLVWDAFTQAELLDQWVAPAPYQSKTKRMNFRVGGERFYAMVSPEGQESWSLQQYTSITPQTHFTYLSFFADKDENPFLPGSHWDLTFSEKNGITQVSITIHNESLERMDKMLELGFREGYTATLNALEGVLKRVNHEKRN
ncbi:MAG TPA: SRPBCC domain-containing protein [Chitinophagaceae bacterium]|nr:SRPBCC domain-containing protein [Chitinophagaceae bacterium]